LHLEFVDWLARASLAGHDEADILATACRRLRQGGLPVARGFAGVELIHPLLEGEIFHWSAVDDRVLRTSLDRFDRDESEWLSSPLYCLHANGADYLRRRLGDSYRPGEFPLVDRLMAEGVTDYLALLGRFQGTHAIGERDETFVTFAADDPEGFTDAQVALLRRLTPHIVGALRGATGRRTAYAMMECYLGGDAGRRVLRGGIERGVAEEIDAALWFSDLRGFTTLADTIAAHDLIPMLNAYADCQVTAIHAHGGEVLKFMGDGILAIFPRQRLDDACGAALNAAVAAFAGVNEVNRDRARGDEPRTSLYLGLHVGSVFYGNIGSAERLDFTVVGPSVNETNRIASMCKPLESDLLISAEFARAAPHQAHRLAALGRFALRGVRQPQMLYTLDPAQADNARAFRAP
jgi:adenylate cyclase